MQFFISTTVFYLCTYYIFLFFVIFDFYVSAFFHFFTCFPFSALFIYFWISSASPVLVLCCIFCLFVILFLYLICQAIFSIWCTSMIFYIFHYFLPFFNISFVAFLLLNLFFPIPLPFSPLWMFLST